MFKFEDWRTQKLHVSPISFGLVFDIDIHDSYKTNLGFSQKIDNIVRHFIFTVLPSVIRSSAYNFSKPLIIQ